MFPLCDKSVADVVGSLTANADLRLLFSYLYNVIAVPAAELPFELMSALFHHYNRCGHAYPVGGPSVIPCALANIIQRCGGKVFTKV